jgi:hypothetical protein
MQALIECYSGFDDLAVVTGSPSED